MEGKYRKLGEILVAEGIITQEQLQQAIEFQKKEGGRLGEILIRLNIATEEQIVVALSKQLNIPYITGANNLTPLAEQELDKIVPYDFAIKNLVLPLSRNLNSLTVAVFDPLDLIMLDNLKKITDCEINPVIAPKSDILVAIEEFYGKGKMFREAVSATYDIERDITEIEKEEEEELSLNKLIAQAEGAQVIRLVDLIIREAIQMGASDIHIEPLRDKLSLRYRIDGILYEMPSPAKTLHLPIISRIKILSKMDIAEKRLPQDGGFMVKMDDRMIDLRVSTIPTIYGEKVVLRILDRSRIPLELEKLGFMPNELELLRKGIHNPYGLIFLTGPTGSGKSTTLYAVLNELKSSEKNIITIEDPVEYRISGINQVQVKPEIGLTFASALRSFLRQDPDIILVGEVRDMETAEICVRAALTGHLVLSTLHTNDAASTITRLIDIGIPSYLVASSLRIVIAQRLVRKLCDKCKEPYEITKTNIPSGIRLNVPVLYRAKGCDECNHIGYKGRTVISEIILVNDVLKNLIYNKASEMEIMREAKRYGAYSLLESGIKRVEEGITSLEEILATAIY